MVDEDASCSNDVFPRGTEMPQMLNPSVGRPIAAHTAGSNCRLASEEIRLAAPDRDLGELQLFSSIAQFVNDLPSLLEQAFSVTERRTLIFRLVA